jgi:hypothetical protein
LVTITFVPTLIVRVLGENAKLEIVKDSTTGTVVGGEVGGGAVVGGRVGGGEGAGTGVWGAAACLAGGADTGVGPVTGAGEVPGRGAVVVVVDLPRSVVVVTPGLVAPGRGALGFAGVAVVDVVVCGRFAAVCAVPQALSNTLARPTARKDSHPTVRDSKQGI